MSRCQIGSEINEELNSSFKSQNEKKDVISIKESAKPIHQDQDREYHRTVDYTLAALSERLTFVLCSKFEVDCVEEEIVCIGTKTIDYSDSIKSLHLFHPYLDQAGWMLYHINVFKPPPVFIIYDKDIPQDVRSKFEEIGEDAINDIITDVVRRILESIDFHYFNTNGIFGKVRWRIES